MSENDLPKGITVEEEIDVSEGVIQPFTHGVISTWIGKRKTPAGHRIVRAGRVVGYLAESEKASILLGGAEAKARLFEIEAEGMCRFEADSYSMVGLGAIAEVVPEAFEHPADAQGLLARGDTVERLLSRDLSVVLAKLVENVTVRGAIAVDSGMLIDSAGELPTDGEQLAKEVGETIVGREKVAKGLGFSNSGHWTLHTGDGALLLAHTGEIAIAVWTEANANHTRLVHALRGGLTPVIAFLGPAMAGLLAGSFVVETIFGIPGLGRFYVEAAFNRDYPMILGSSIFFSFLIVSFNLISDLVAAALNPKLRD